jgi:RNA polymerase sigma-70 factor (TIGR02960 family)
VTAIDAAAHEQELLRRARAGNTEAFAAIAERCRGELQLHCYRIVGSVQDAEDLVQETLLAAWRGLDGFEGRTSVRSWLYRIATNRSLNAVRDRARRPPQAPPPPEPSPPPPQPTGRPKPAWLQPYPDVLLEGALEQATDPESRYEARESVGLAFIVALQRLPPRQRAALVLRDVLGYRAAEEADILETTEVAVNRALHRARRAIDELLPDRQQAPLPESREEQQLVSRFTAAFESGDVAGVVALLTANGVLRMPPEGIEYQGRAAIAEFLSTVPANGQLQRFRLISTRANGQPAFGCYLRDPHTPIAHAYGLMVLTLSGDQVAEITGFADTGVFGLFGSAENPAALAAMAYDERLADRVRERLREWTDVTERRMFGGLTFMLGGHMCCGINNNELILRLAPEAEDTALTAPHARPMDFTRRPMRGFVTIAPDGLTGPSLDRWIAQAVAHAESLPPKASHAEPPTN